MLEDIRDAAAFIREAVRGKTLDDYHGDRVLRQAIERNFEIIGEAMKRLAQQEAIVARIKASLDDARAGRLTRHDTVEALMARLDSKGA